MATSENYKLASVNIASPRTVYPTAPGLSLGLQPSAAGDSIFDATTSLAFTGLGTGAFWGGGSAAAGKAYSGLPTGGQNVQLNASGGAVGGAGASAGTRNAQSPPQAAGTAVTGGFVANPLTWVLVLAVLVAVIIFTAHRVGKSEEFSNIRGSAYNIFYVSLIAIVGILVLKTILGRVKVPGLSDAILAV